MKSYCMRLVLLAKRCGEMFPDCCEETRCYVAAMRNAAYDPFGGEIGSVSVRVEWFDCGCSGEVHGWIEIFVLIR